jgi:streptomycin 6-kinase
MLLPTSLVAHWRHEPDWLDALPSLVRDCEEQWGLRLEAPIETPHSLVVPAGDVVLKLSAPSHFEADHEADALEAWRGEGAVRLVARDDELRALLVERCRPGARLWDSGEDEPPVVAGLLATLSRSMERGHPFRFLADEARRWAHEVPERYERSGKPFEPALLEEALAVFRSVEESANALVNQDLHGANVLSAGRAPWLVVDPKPLVGERELDGVGALRNAHARKQGVARWLDALSDLGLDRERLRGWGIAHTLAWAWEERGGWSRELVDAARAIAASR